MKSYTQLAKAAYEAHAAAEERQLGGASEPWQHLTPAEQECWIATAKAIAAELATVH